MAKEKLSRITIRKIVKESRKRRLEKKYLINSAIACSLGASLSPILYLAGFAHFSMVCAVFAIVCFMFVIKHWIAMESAASAMRTLGATKNNEELK